jgi:hypothetical protein
VSGYTTVSRTVLSFVPDRLGSLELTTGGQDVLNETKRLPAGGSNGSESLTNQDLGDTSHGA